MCRAVHGPNITAILGFAEFCTVELVAEADSQYVRLARLYPRDWLLSFQAVEGCGFTGGGVGLEETVGGSLVFRLVSWTIWSATPIAAIAPTMITSF